MKNSYSFNLKSKANKTPKLKPNLFPTTLVSKIYDPSPKPLLSPTLQPALHFTDNKRIKNFQEFLSNCDDLVKDVNSLSVDIEQSITERKSIIKKTLKPTSTNIRNEFYFDGRRKIEESLKLRTEKQKNNELKNLKTLAYSISIDNSGNFITLQDLNTQAGIEFLAENRREFGGKFNGSVDKFGKEEVVMRRDESLGKGSKRKGSVEESPKKVMIHRYSAPDILEDQNSPRIVKFPSIRKKKKFPIVNKATLQVMRAKAEANQFFADKNMISNGLKKKRRWTYIK